jgi:nucleoside transporter
LSRLTRIRLCAMMFLQYFSIGAFMPILSLYLKEHLHFSGSQIGAVLAAFSIAAFISPVIGAFIADRLIRAEYLLVICNLCAAGLMMALSYQTKFSSVFQLYLIYSIIIGPTIALTTSVTFHHSPDTRHQFGNIRVWGTIGWIVVAWVFSFFWLGYGDTARMATRLPDCLKLAAISSLIVGLYAMTLPKTNIKLTGPARIIPRDSLAVILKPEVMFLSAIGFLISFVDRFNFLGASPFLKAQGFSDFAIMPAMSLGQVSEVLTMGLLGWLLVKAGFKRVLMLGVLMQVARFAFFAFDGIRPFIYAGLLSHGPAFTFFFIVSSIYIDSKSDSQSRSGVHQLFSIINVGFGQLLGSLVAGWTADLVTNPVTGVVNYPIFWSVPMIISVFCLVLLAFFFPDKKVKVPEGERVFMQDDSQNP